MGYCGKPVGNRPPRRPRSRWEDNIKIYLRDIGWSGMGWIHMTKNCDQRRALVNTVIKLHVP
jgi:hypothetical protein